MTHDYPGTFIEIIDEPWKYPKKMLQKAKVYLKKRKNVRIWECAKFCSNSKSQITSDMPGSQFNTTEIWITRLL